MRGDSGTAIRLVCTLVVVLGAVAPPAIAVSPISDDGSPDISPVSSPPVHQQSTPESTNDSRNGSDVPHENPDEIDDEDELDRLLSYLSGRMNSKIGTSTVRLSRGEYAAAKAALGDGYTDSLGKYVDVEGETDRDGASERYETVQETHREYVDTVREFRETEREYRAAKRAGDDERARELARRLTRLANEGERQASTLGTAFESISNQTGGDLSESRTQVESIQANLSEQRDEIARLEFTDTRISVEPHDSSISFSDPLVLTGTLETENGTPVDLTTARFAIGEQTIQTPVNATGSFTLTYRPVGVPVNASTLTVRYRPEDASMYRTSDRALPVSITQVDATARVSRPQASAYGYADSIALRTNVSVDGRPVGQYPVSAWMAGVEVSAGTTTTAGGLTLDGTIPAATPVGNTTVRVEPRRSDRAVTFDAVKKTVQIASEATTLDATARVSEGRSLVVDGRLRTREGDVVDGQPLTVTVGSRTVETTTGESGAYRTTVDVPPDVSVANATVTVAFDGDGTNLESTATTTDIEQSATGDTAEGGVLGGGGLDSGLPFAVMDLVWVAAGTGLVGLLAVVLLRRRTGGGVPAPADTERTSPGGEGDGGPDAEPAALSELDSATAALSTGNPNDAVVVAYTAVRHAFAGVAGVDESATHWEFYQQCLDAGVGDADALEALTAGYESAAYSGRAVSEADAARLVERATTLVTDSSTADA